MVSDPIYCFDEAELAVIRDSTHKGWAMGDGRFRAMIEALGERRASPAAKGRPRKVEENGV